VLVKLREPFATTSKALAEHVGKPVYKLMVQPYKRKIDDVVTAENFVSRSRATVNGRTGAITTHPDIEDFRPLSYPYEPGAGVKNNYLAFYPDWEAGLRENGLDSL
jgi:hypothetical protein